MDDQPIKDTLNKTNASYHSYQGEGVNLSNNNSDEKNNCLN